MVIRPLIWVITIVTLQLEPLRTTQKLPSRIGTVLLKLRQLPDLLKGHAGVSIQYAEGGLNSYEKITP